MDGVRIEIHTDTCPLVAVGHDPGLWLKGAGLLLGVVGVVGTMAPWRAQRRGLRAALALGTLGLAGATSFSLCTTGLMARSPWHTGLAAAWGVALAAWLLWPPGRGEFSLQEEL